MVGIFLAVALLAVADIAYQSGYADAEDELTGAGGTDAD
jgi:hypothetical protein